MKPVQKLIAVAQGREAADLLVRGAQVFNVFTGVFEERDVRVSGGYVASVLPSGALDGTDAGETAACVVDGAGQWLVPGFTDAHLHLESGMVCPAEFAAVAAANGVTTLIADPHEVANIFGARGIRYMLDATEEAAARVFFMLPSCVPASALDRAAATLEAEDLEPFFTHPRILGLGEMMNYPGVLNGAVDVVAKLNSVHRYNRTAFGYQGGLSIDGHAPTVTGAALHAYAAAGVRSDHEASSVEEARALLEAGMGLMMREASGAKNMLDLVPVVNEHTAPFCMLCTDDRHPEDLVEQGSINAMVRQLVADGRLPLPTILRMACHNAARLFSLRDLGAIAPGYRADFALYSDLTEWKPNKVWRGGVCVAEGGVPTQPVTKIDDRLLRNSVVLAETVGAESLRVADKGTDVRVIAVVPHQLTTRATTARLPVSDSLLQADPAQDIAKLAVFERHRKTGRVGVGFVKGMGLQRGAVASSVAHDSHNLVVVGTNDADMMLAVDTLKKVGGGLAACVDGTVAGVLPLPLAGLFSDKRLDAVYAEVTAMTQAVRGLGLAAGNDPFMTLAFLSLAVLPSLRLTDDGLVDVEAFAFTSLYVE